MRRPLTVLLALAAGAAPAAARAVTGGTIELGLGTVPGVNVGMSRSSVLERLGRPFFVSRYGYMQYMPDGADGIFDVYTTSTRPRSLVRMIGIASHGRAFKLTDGTAIFEPGALRSVKRTFGRALQLVRLRDGERVYRLRRAFDGLRTITDFSTTRPSLDARVVQIFIIKTS
jgi:hypothetical protein